MRIGVLGTGVVGQTLAGRLVELDHEVVMGSRTSDNHAATTWALKAGDNARHGTFADAALAGDLIINCTSGRSSLAALEAAGAANLAGKVLLDLANPLDHSQGFTSLEPVNSDSLGEQIQRAFPDARVVKSLNTMNALVMVDPSRVRAQTVFLSGDDDASKTTVRGLLGEFGWRDVDIIDLGGIETARGTEMFLPLWVHLMRALGTVDFGVHVTGS